MKNQVTRAGDRRTSGGLRLIAAIAAAAMILPISVNAAHAAGTARPLGAAAVDTARQLAADTEPGTWMSSGRT